MTHRAAVLQTEHQRSHEHALHWFSQVPLVVWPFILIFSGISIIAVLSPWIAPHNPVGQALADRLTPPVFLPGGTPKFLLGTDYLGRDILSRVMVGSRASLAVGIGGVLIGSLLGISVGLVAGYFGGWLDDVLMTLGDIQLSFPNILLAIAVIAVLGPDTVNLIIVVGVSGWVVYGRVTRGIVMSLRSREFVVAVHSMGGTTTRIILRHILPNVFPTLIVLGTLDLARIIIMESTLSFLGLGIQPPTPSWGSMIGEGRQYLDIAWWIAVVPGVALLLTTISIARIGDWLRDMLDPMMRPT